MLIYQIAVGSFIGICAAVGAMMAVQSIIDQYKNKKDDK
jgi:hypothetical protein